MILVGNQRGNGQNLALHLMKEENEHVQLHELRGFVAKTLAGAFQESHAISRGTRCSQHLYSLSLSPPKGASVDNATFINAVDRAEKRLGLEGQPRAVVFHEKKGRDGETRRHAHAVWCRIDGESMTAKRLSHDRYKLNALARDLYVEHDWQMPRGFISKDERNPRNYSLAEWQQAKRAERDPDKLKRMFQDAWAISDSQAAFAHALEEKVYILARGDRRGFVAVDHKREVYSLSRWIGKKPRAMKARLSSYDDLPSVEQAHAQAAKIITDRLKELEVQEREKAARETARLAAEQQAITAKAHAENAALQAAQHLRQIQEKQERHARLKGGLRGLWQRLTGERKKVTAQNLTETAKAQARDKTERTALCREEAATRRRAERRAAFAKARGQAHIEELQEDQRMLTASCTPKADDGQGGGKADRGADADRSETDKKAAFRKRRSRPRDNPRPKRGRSRSPTRNGPEPSL